MSLKENYHPTEKNHTHASPTLVDGRIHLKNLLENPSSEHGMKISFKSFTTN